MKQLFQILEYRNDEILIQLNHAQQRTSESTKLIAAAAKEENRTAAMVLTASQADSQVIKILTYVAMVYLPASLMAVCLTSPQCHDMRIGFDNLRNSPSSTPILLKRTLQKIQQQDCALLRGSGYTFCLHWCYLL
jgi:hypothetical protein